MMRLNFKPWSLAALGGLLLAQSAYLVTVKVTHLGVILPAGLGVVLVFLGTARQHWRLWLEERALRQQAWKWVRAGFWLWLASLLGFFSLLALRQQGQDLQGLRPDVIVVLGSSTPNVQPSPTLVERLNLAYALAQQHPKAKVIVSGGVDFRQTVSEASVMGAYLESRGLEKGRILLEERSTSTHENLVFSRRLLQADAQAPEPAMALVTSDFHTLRAGWIAEKTGWKNVTTAGAPTPLYMRYNAWLREYFALLSGLLLREY
ncbi:MAG: YdcF family protein [Pseudomonadota bacterium]|nr:YdcF family protein [Pseudomonadota bacterium]